VHCELVRIELPGQPSAVAGQQLKTAGLGEFDERRPLGQPKQVQRARPCFLIDHAQCQHGSRPLRRDDLAAPQKRLAVAPGAVRPRIARLPPKAKDTRRGVMLHFDRVRIVGRKCSRAIDDDRGRGMLQLHIAPVHDELGRRHPLLPLFQACLVRSVLGRLLAPQAHACSPVPRSTP